MSRILLDSTTCLMCVRGGLLLCVTKTMLPLVQVWDNVYTVHLYVTVLRKPNLLREKYVLWDCNTRMCIYMYTAIFNDVITHFSPLPLSLSPFPSLFTFIFFSTSPSPRTSSLQIKLRHADQEIRLAQDPFPLYPDEILKQVVTQLKVVPANTALRLRAVLDFVEEGGTRRIAGDEWLFEGPG